jgi:antirestriction protein ArdC
MAVAKTKTFETKKKLTQNEIIDSINDKVIAGLQEKGLQWFKPFKDGVTGSFQALSAYGRPYKGWNQFVLSSIALENGWINKWYTFAHIQKCEGYINKGESGTDIFMWQISYAVEKDGKITYYPTLAKVPDADKAKVKKSFYLKQWKVWSISQTNIPHNTPNLEITEEVEELEAHADAEAILQGWSAVVPVKHAPKGEAYYSPRLDFIQMPEKSSKMWQSSGDYYKVFFHEAIHSTGHKSRLNRLEETARFGNEEYSKEELVAEMGALYLEAITGIDCLVDDFKNSQAYINGWIKAIANDKNLIMQSSKKSQEAVSLILSKVA